MPKPARPIPIWLGGLSDPAFDRAARLADGFIFFAGGVDHTIDSWNRLRDRVHDLGTSVEDFGADYVGASPGWHRRPHGRGRCLAHEVPMFRWSAMDLGLDSANAHIECLASVAEALH